MYNINQDLQDLCAQNGVEIWLLQELIRVEKSNLTNNRWSIHKNVIESTIRKYI